MTTHPPINDAVALEVLHKIGEEGLLSIGSLLKAWDGKKVEYHELPSPQTPQTPQVIQTPHDQKFVDSTRLELALASDEIKSMGEEIKTLRKDLESRREESHGLRKDLDQTRHSLEESIKMMKKMKEEVEDSREDIDSLLKVNKDIYEKLEYVEEKADSSLLGKRSVCSDPDWFSKKMKMVEEVEPIDFEEVANML